LDVDKKTGVQAQSVSDITTQNFASAVKQTTTQDQEKKFRDLAKKHNTVVLHPVDQRPSYVKLYLALRQILPSPNFSMVITTNGNYAVSSKMMLLPQILRKLANPTIALADCKFKMTSYDQPTEDFIIKGIPEFIPKELLLSNLANVFKQDSAITNLRQIRRKISLENGETLLLATGEYLFTVSNPPENPPVYLHYGINSFRILRKNACFYCGHINHMKKDCPQLQQRALNLQKKQKNQETIQGSDLKNKKIQKLETPEPTVAQSISSNPCNNSSDAQQKKKAKETKTMINTLPSKPLEYDETMSQQGNQQFATIMDYEFSDKTEEELRKLYGNQYDQKREELLELSKVENHIMIDENGRRIVESDTELTEGSFSDNEEPPNPKPNI
jgi:molybdopterin converting factor small subunit